MPCKEVLKLRKGGWVTDTLYQFENYILDVDKRRLFQNGEALNVDVRTIDLLVCLIQASPNWVDKNDLLDRLWPDQEITDWALSRLVSDTRKLLGDDGDAQRIIRTVRGRGFQFYDGFKRLGLSEIPMPGADTEGPASFIAKSLWVKYFLAGAFLLIVAWLGMTYLPNTPAEKNDVTALVNLSISGNSRLNNILEDWALSQDDMILIKDSTGSRDTKGANLFKHYCGDSKCNQLILITERKNGKAVSLRYQVMSEGIKKEERELISTNQNFLISALRDVVANSMNRPSDYFAVPMAILMQHPDQIYQDMYRMYINLENTYVTFVAQARRRDELVELITKRLHIKRKQQYEKFFVTYFDQMNQEERFIFDQMRAMTSGTLYQGNRNMLRLLENNPSLIRELPKLGDVRKHLSFWLKKYDTIFVVRKDMGLLYVGVEDAVPFPSGIDGQVSAWLKAYQEK